MRVLVCGGRDFRDRAAMARALDPLRNKMSALMSGGAPGADTMAWDWGWTNHFPCERYMADWKTHGRAAGPIRNQRMIDEGKPDLVIAFPGGRGTADMIRRAKAAGIEVREG
ncbi:DUF2493 domain-containing protein [Kaistia nematophila]|uniref:DUF2493 domain-containing protein n=1 Tax=Kaistia nematophila TaxID=2994654 RepID=A0A9X3E1F8_9HYPH|nr:DUF2493 domain-containing protein [Kaistia nematophila]MCX5569652.1 DUF2493 domain-containing protein [Kaistia nematophila]